MIEVFYKNQKFDVVSKEKIENIKIAKYKFEFNFQTEHIYEISNLTKEELEQVASKLLIDPITQNFSVDSKERYAEFHIVDVWLKKGVTDPVGETIEKSIKTLGIEKETKFKTGIRYL